MARILQIIFQKSLDSGQILSDGKKAIVTPLLKKGNKCDPANDRPNLTDLHLLQINGTYSNFKPHKHLNSHNVLYDLQHGFSERKSCETQLIQLVDEIARNLSSGHQTDLILLDFSKAFDKVCHTKLLYKLHQHGLNPETISAGLRLSYSGVLNV